MKVTENNNYGQYLKSRLIDIFSQTTNYFYVGLITLALGFIWYRDGIWTSFKVLTAMTNAFAVAFLLTEGLMTLMYKEFKRNKYITYLLTIVTLTAVNISFFDEKTLYWSFVAGLIFMIPIVVSLLVDKIRS